MIWLPEDLEPKDDRQRKFIETLERSNQDTKDSNLIRSNIEGLKTIMGGRWRVGGGRAPMAKRCSPSCSGAGRAMPKWRGIVCAVAVSRSEIRGAKLSWRYAETSLTMPGLVSGMAGRDSNSTKSFT